MIEALSLTGGGRARSLQHEKSIRAAHATRPSCAERSAHKNLSAFPTRSGFTKVQDLAGKRVSAIKGSSSELAVRKALPTATTVTFQDPPSGFLAMQQGKVDGFVLSELSLVKLKRVVDNCTTHRQQRESSKDEPPMSRPWNTFSL